MWQRARLNRACRTCPHATQPGSRPATFFSSPSLNTSPPRPRLSAALSNDLWCPGSLRRWELTRSWESKHTECVGPLVRARRCARACDVPRDAAQMRQAAAVAGVEVVAPPTARVGRATCVRRWIAVSCGAECLLTWQVRHARVQAGQRETRASENMRVRADGGNARHHGQNRCGHGEEPT